MRGAYILFDKDGNEIAEIPNALIAEGHAQLVRVLFNRDSYVDWSFVFGVFSEVPTYNQTQLAQYTSEPTIGVNGYQRVTLQATGWTIVAGTDTVYAQSATIAFTGAGGNFDKTFNRMFMHLRVEQPSTAFTQYLTSISSAIATAKQVVNGETFNTAYRMYLK